MPTETDYYTKVDIVEEHVIKAKLTKKNLGKK